MSDTGSDTTITIYGHSDDCIEIDGALSEEGYVGPDGRGVAIVTTRSGDAAVFDVHYDKRGVWRVKQRGEVGGLRVDIAKGPEEEDETGYTDRATVTGRIARVEVRKSWPPGRADKIEEIEAALEHKNPDLVDALWAEVRRYKGAA